MSCNDFWIPLQDLLQYEKERVEDLKIQGEYLQSKKLTTENVVFVDSGPVDSGGDGSKVGSSDKASNQNP